MSQKSPLLQNQFRYSSVGAKQNIDATLDALFLQLHQVEGAARHNDASPFQEQVTTLDFDLLRYACTLLKARLVEAARLDCAQLIANSVLDVSEENKAAEAWAEWLGAGPCWSQLAEEQWRHAASLVTDIVVSRLNAEGVQLDHTAITEIDHSIVDLELKDLLPEATYHRFFPAISEPIDDADDG